MAEDAALDIARYIRSAPDRQQEISVTLYRMLKAVKEVTVERPPTLTYKKKLGKWRAPARARGIRLSSVRSSRLF